MTWRAIPSVRGGQRGVRKSEEIQGLGTAGGGLEPSPCSRLRPPRPSSSPVSKASSRGPKRAPGGRLAGSNPMPPGCRRAPGSRGPTTRRPRPSGCPSRGSCCAASREVRFGPTFQPRRSPSPSAAFSQPSAHASQVGTRVHYDCSGWLSSCCEAAATVVEGCRSRVMNWRMLFVVPRYESNLFTPSSSKPVFASSLCMWGRL